MLSDCIFRLSDDKTAKYYDFFSQIHQVFYSGDISYQMQLRSMFFSFLGEMVSLWSTGEKSKNVNVMLPIHEAVNYIDNNFNSNITTEKLAKMCCISESTFRRSFKKHYNMSPVQYRNMLRLTQAKDLIESGLYLMTEISYITNFSDAAHFAKNFKKLFGVSPSEYKRQKESERNIK